MICIIVQPINVMANIQIPVKDISIDDIFYIIGQDIVTGKPIIRPTMTVSWQEPDKWESAADPKEVHSPDFYELRVNNKTSGVGETIKIESGTQEFNDKAIDVHDEMVLDTGSLYELSIQPYHYHKIVVDGEVTQVLAPSKGAAKQVYGITDLNVELRPEDNSIEVVWDDIGLDSFDYRIVYAVGDYSNKSKQELLNNKEGEVNNLSVESGKIDKFYDTVKKRNRLSYKLEQNIYPGQIYSIMVEPVTEYYNSKPIVKNVNYPYIWTCSTNIDLQVYEDGEYVRLEWNIPASFKVGQEQSEYELVNATLLEYVNDQPSNIAIFNKDAATMEYYRVRRPNHPVEYQLQLCYKAVGDTSKIPIEPRSKKVPFVPQALNISPTKPIVPNLMTKSILNTLKNKPLEVIKNELEKYYLVPGDSYNDNISELLDANRTFNVVEDKDSINFVWGAFKRKDVLSTSSTYGDIITDTDVYYDIYVTKDLESLAGAKKIIDTKKYTDSSSTNILKNSKDEIVGYKQTLDYYYDKDKTDLQRMTPGNLYYIKIVAKKKYGNEENVSEPTIVSLYFGYNGDAFEPPAISKPPLKIKDKDTTTTEVAIVWKEKWWEVIAKDTVKYKELSQWTSNVWVVNENKTAKIYTKYVEGAEYFKIYEDEKEIKRLVDYVKNIDSVKYTDFELISRKIDLGADQFGVSDVKYKFCKIPYSLVQKEINLRKKDNPDYSFVDYYEKLVSDDKNGISSIAWEDIKATRDVDDESYLYYKQDALLPNTLYLYMLYPYRQLYSGQMISAHYPAPIVVATKPEDSTVNPDPTVPNLYISDYTDTTMTLAWKYNTNFEYEIRYSLTEDVKDAQVWEWKLPDDPLNPLYPTDGAYYEVTVDDLFPDTQYYFWIRSKQPKTGHESPWSNAAIGTTKDISNPLPPRGIGVASNESMKKHKYDASVTEDYISIEWLLNEDDKAKPQEDESSISKKFVYLMEVADNGSFIDPIYIEVAGGEGDIKPDNVEILEKYLVKINKLIGNRFYYVRMKTRVIVTGKEEGQLIIKDSSSYSDPIRILTKYSNSEYDGHTDPELEILPSKDYELIYDKDEKLLTYRFRSNETGQDDMADNNVDQRLITNLIKHNTYVYKIDVSKFKGNPITKRKVLIPHSVMKAFDTHKVNILINTGDMTLEIPYESLKSNIDKQVNNYAAVPTLNISFDQFDNNYVKEFMPEDALVSVGIPQKLGIYISTDKGISEIKNTDKEMTMNVKAKPRYSLYGKDVITYRKDTKFNKWQVVDGEYDNYSGDVTFSTGSLGVFGVYVTDQDKIDEVQPNIKTHWSENARKEIANKYNISGLDDYDPNSNVTEKQMLNILYGVLTDERTIDMNKYIDKNTIRQLTNSGISKKGTSDKKTISREDGFNMFVRTYEIINDKTVKYDKDVLNNIQNDSTVGSEYKESVAKAIKLGLISDARNIRAKDSMKFGEMFSVWSKIE